MGKGSKPTSSLAILMIYVLSFNDFFSFPSVIVSSYKGWSKMGQEFMEPSQNL
jgi:hypothetical protein